MAIAVTARLDRVLTDRINGLCRLVGEREPTIEPQPAYAPHITLAVMQDAGVLTEELVKELTARCDGTTVVPVAVSHLGVFPGATAYVFLAPVVTKALLHLHEQVVDSVPSGMLHPHHATGCWVPHITVASVKQNPARVLEASLCDLGDFRGQIVALDLVSFPPVEVIASFPLCPEAES